jgi:hypothetical protein
VPKEYVIGQTPESDSDWSTDENEKAMRGIKKIKIKTKAKEASAQDLAAGFGGLRSGEPSQYDGLSRLRLIRACKEREIEFSAVAKDDVGLRNLLESADNKAAKVLARKGKKERSVTGEAPTEKKKGKRGSAREYQDMGRLKLIKLCKEKKLEYKAVQKDVAGLIKLLIASE